MVRKKTYTRVATSCLIGGLLLFPLAGFTAPFNLGLVTQVQGEITFLDFTPPLHKLSEVKENTKFITDGSYLTKEDAFLTVQLFDGSWLRLSPRSKVSAEFDAVAKVVTLHLFTGSVKALISSSQNGEAVHKLVVKSADAVFEASEGKFSVVRNPITNVSSVYVEKGVVIATHNGTSKIQEGQLIHRLETTSLKDRDLEFDSPRKMTEKESSFLHPSNYLKNLKGQN